MEESRCHAVRRVVRSRLSCSAALCGRRKELFELPGRSEKYCLECSADVASSILPFALRHRIGVIVYSPMASGLLSVLLPQVH